MVEIYISTDIETDGPIPGPHSMLSLASVALTSDKKCLSTFYANLKQLPEASGHPKTMAWWATQPEAWKQATESPQEPVAVMNNYVAWVKSLPGIPVFVAYPVGFDFTFVYWYLMKYVGESPFWHSAVDIKTYSMALLKKGYREAGKDHMPAEWFDDLPHTHNALDDAMAQGMLFCNMLQYNLKRGQ